MSLKSLLESFEGRTSPPSHPMNDAAQVTENDVAQARAASFEAGYTSGWEDAHKSDTAAKNRIAAEFERNIESLAFSYHEAVDLVRKEVFGFVDAIVTSILPSLLPEITREQLRATLKEMGDQHLSLPIEIVVSSDSKAMVEQLMAQNVGLEITLVEDATLAPHQVFVRLNSEEAVIDVNPMIDSLKRQLNALHDNAEIGEKTHAGT